MIVHKLENIITDEIRLSIKNWFLHIQIAINLIISFLEHEQIKEDNIRSDRDDNGFDDNEEDVPMGADMDATDEIGRPRKIRR